MLFIIAGCHGHPAIFLGATRSRHHPRTSINIAAVKPKRLLRRYTHNPVHGTKRHVQGKDMCRVETYAGLRYTQDKDTMSGTLVCKTIQYTPQRERLSDAQRPHALRIYPAHPLHFVSVYVQGCPFNIFQTLTTGRCQST